MTRIRTKQNQARRKKEPTRLTYTVEEAAKLLGIGRTSAYKAAARGELGGVRVIRVRARLLVPKPALDRVLNGNWARPGELREVER